MPDLDTLASNTVSGSTLETEQLHQEVAALGGRWALDGVTLKCELRRRSGMAKCGIAAAYASSLADEMDHHPRIVLEHGAMTLTIHTRNAKAITVTDLVYAARFERWLRSNGWA